MTMKTMMIASGALALAMSASLPAHATSPVQGEPQVYNFVDPSGPQAKAGYQTVHYRGIVSKRRIYRKLSRRGFYNFSRIKRRGHAYIVRATTPRGYRAKIILNVHTGRIIRVKYRHHRPYRPYGPYAPYGHGWNSGGFSLHFGF